MFWDHDVPRTNVCMYTVKVQQVIMLLIHVENGGKNKCIDTETKLNQTTNTNMDSMGATGFRLWEYQIQKPRHNDPTIQRDLCANTTQSQVWLPLCFTPETC